MVTSKTTIMAIAMLVGLVSTLPPCLGAQSPMYAPMMSPGIDMAPAPATDCLTALANVSDCLTFVQNGSKLTAPDKACCPEFAGLLESNGGCLCQLVGQADDYGVDISRALMLPDACKVQLPDSILASCSTGTATPAPTPTPSTEIGSTAPGSAAAMSPSDPSIGGSNGASSTTVRDLSTLVCLVAAILIAYYF